MAQRSPPKRGRALIVEDEVLFALNLEAEMQTLGFDICDLAANGHQASILAMSNQPDVVLMDVNLPKGAAKGLRSADGLIRCTKPLLFLLADTRTATQSGESANKCRTPRVLPKGSYYHLLAAAVAEVTPHQH